MKTISELNEKVWYRLIKVVYIILLVVCILFSWLLVYVFNPLPSNHLSSKGFSKLLDNYSEAVRILKAYKVWEKYKIDFKPDYENIFEQYANEYQIDETKDDKIIEKIGKAAKMEYPEYMDMGNLELGKKTYSKYFLGRAFTGNLLIMKLLIGFYGIISVAIIAFLFEIFRRSFYYIVLGKLFPPK